LIQQFLSPKGSEYVVTTAFIVEALLGLALLSGRLPRTTLFLSIVLLTASTGLLLMARRHGFTGVCGCFGRLLNESVRAASVRIFLLIACCILAFFFTPSPSERTET